MGNDPNIDATKQKIDPALWLEMKIAAIRKGQRIYEWLSNAIRNQLKAEKENEK